MGWLNATSLGAQANQSGPTPTLYLGLDHVTLT